MEKINIFVCSCVIFVLLAGFAFAEEDVPWNYNGKPLEHWEKQLSDPDKNTQIFAVGVIARFADVDDNAVSILVKLLDSKDESIKYMAAYRVFLLKPELEKPFTIIAKYLDSEEESVRLRTAYYLQSGGEPVLKKFIEYITNKKNSVRSRVAVIRGIAFRQEKGQKALKLLVSLLKDDSPEIRIAALSTILAINLKGKDIINTVHAFLKDKDQSVRYAAARTLANLASDNPLAMDALPLLIKDLENIDFKIDISKKKRSIVYYWPRPRWKYLGTILAIQKLGPKAKAAIPVLIKLLDVGEDITRKMCRSDRIGQPRFYPKQAAADAAVKALIAIGKEAVPELIKALDRKDVKFVHAFKQRIINIIGALGPVANAAVPKLIAMVPVKNINFSIYNYENIIDVISKIDPECKHKIKKEILIECLYFEWASKSFIKYYIKDAAPELIDLYVEGDHRTRNRIYRVIPKIGMSAFNPLLKKLDLVIKERTRLIKEKTQRNKKKISDLSEELRLLTEKRNKLVNYNYKNNKKQVAVLDEKANLLLKELEPLLKDQKQYNTQKIYAANGKIQTICGILNSLGKPGVVEIGKIVLDENEDEGMRAMIVYGMQPNKNDEIQLLQLKYLQAFYKNSREYYNRQAGNLKLFAEYLCVPAHILKEEILKDDWYEKFAQAKADVKTIKTADEYLKRINGTDYYSVKMEYLKGLDKICKDPKIMVPLLSELIKVKESKPGPGIYGQNKLIKFYLPLNILKKFGPEAAPALPVLIEWLKKCQADFKYNEEYYYAVISVLGAIGQKAKGAEEYAFSNHSRFHAVLDLAKIGSVKRVEDLIPMLKNKGDYNHEYRQKLLIEALGIIKTKNPEAIKVLVDVMKINGRLAFDALITLGKLDSIPAEYASDIVDYFFVGTNYYRHANEVGVLLKKIGAPALLSLLNALEKANSYKIYHLAMMITAIKPKNKELIAKIRKPLLILSKDLAQQELVRKQISTYLESLQGDKDK